VSTENIKHDVQDTVPGRRKFLNTAALAGLAGAGLSVGLSSCKQEAAPTAAAPAAAPAPAPAAAHGAAAGELNLHPAPGQLDTYYGVWSGGHSGEVRVLGLPSGREIKRIPTFNIDCMNGWGITNETKAIIGTRADGSLKYKTGDTHHVHGSYADGTYDGKYFWVNDKIHGRLARIRGDIFECDKITEIPNIQGFHGIFPDKRDPVNQAVNRTTRVFCGNEFHIPHPNDGRDMDDPTKYRTLFTCIDAETMEVRWQCRVDGNMDLVATSYNGRLAAANQYNTEGGAHYEDMMSAEKDACVFFDVARIEKAVKDGKFTTIGDSKVPVVDGTKEANKDPKTALTCYVPVPKNPHGVNASPDGKYFICSGKLSPTGTVIELAKVEDFLDGKLDDLNKSIVAEVELGLGPLHTTFDGRGNAFTTLFLDSQIVKWNVDAAIKFHAGDKNAKYVIDRIDVHYQPGHISADMGETKEAGGMFLAVGCKFSKDRFLPVGPLHPENEQLIDIRGEKMKHAGRAPGLPRAPRLRHRQAREDQDPPGLQRRRLPECHQGSEGLRRLPQREQGHRQTRVPGACLQPAGVQGQEGRRSHAHPDQPGQSGRPDPRLRHPEVRHQLRRQSPGNQVGHLQGRQAGCVLVLLHALLPRTAP
jgi:nitrous-oxide reductase